MSINSTGRAVVVVADPMHEDGVEMLREHFDVLTFKPNEKEACIEAIHGADAVIVRTFIVDAAVINESPRLRAIVKHGAGVDNIDIPAASARAIAVANSGDANAESVAEATVSLMFAALRKTTQMHKAMQDGNYDIRWGLLLEGISGKTLGLVGFGNIGRKVAKMCQHGFAMKVIAFDPYISAEQMAAHGAEKAETLEDLLRRSDIVSLHAGLAYGSAALIGKPQLALMKKSAILVNTARGGLIDETALAHAITSGDIYGAGLDVLAEEPPLRTNPLMTVDNVVLSPHIGGATSSARKLMATRSADAVIAILQNRKAEFPLN